MIDVTEVAVLRKVLLIGVIGVDVGGCVVAVGLAVDKALQGQTVAEGTFLGRPANGEGGDGHDETGQLEDVDDLLGLIDGGTQVAVAQTFLVHEVAERLRIEQGVDGRVLEREEVVVAGLGLTLLAPAGGAVEVGTDGEYHGGLRHHGLVEVGRGQALLHRGVAGDDDTVELQVAHGLCTTGLCEEAVEERFVHFTLTILADATPCQQVFHAAKVQKITEMGNNLVNLMVKVVRKWKLLCTFAGDKRLFYNMTETKVTLVERLAHRMAAASQHTENPLTDEQVQQLLDKMFAALTPDEEELVTMVAKAAVKEVLPNQRPEVTEVRPKELECDVVRFQNNKDKWVALVGLLNGYPYEIFTGLQDDEEGILLPKSVTKGKIIKQVNSDGTKRYDFQFENTRGYKITVEGLSEKFNPEYWNYAKLISGVLRYRMPIEHVIKLVSSLQLQSENINTWKNGVERALKKYLGDGAEVTDNEDNAE